MPEDKQALLKHYRDMRSLFLDAIEGLTDDQMNDPTIDGWSVKDHLVHLALWDDIRASEVARISAGYDSAWKMTGGQDEAFNAMGYEIRKDFSVPQAKWELTRSRESLIEALEKATPRALDPTLYGEAGLVSSHEQEHAGWIKRWRGEKGI